MSEGSNKSGYVVSTAMHGALLGLLVFSLAGAPKFEDQPESIPVDTLTQDQFNQIMHGERTAPPAKAPVEPPPRPVAAEPPPAPLPPQPPPELKHVDETPPAPPPKPVADVSPEPPVKPKPPEKPKDPTPTPKPPVKEKTAEAAKPPPKMLKPFDLTAIAKLVKTADATPTGATVQGLADQHDERMSPSLLAALDSWLRETYTNCWSAPPGIPDGEPYVAAVRVEFNADGSLSGPPRLVNPPQNPAWRPHAESAVRATLKCDPLHVPAQFAPYYAQWRTKTIHFDPRDALD